MYKQELFLIRQTILGKRTVQSTQLWPIPCVHELHYFTTHWHSLTPVFISSQTFSPRLRSLLNVNIYNVTTPISASISAYSLTILARSLSWTAPSQTVCVQGGSKQLRGGLLLMWWRYEGCTEHWQRFNLLLDKILTAHKCCVTSLRPRAPVRI